MHVVIVPIIFLSFGLLEVVLGVFANRENSTRRDVILEVLCALAFGGVIVPFIFFSSKVAMTEWLPASVDALAHWPMWAMFGVLLLADDMVQYWWHRTTHSLPFLYLFHRAHHSGEYMSVRVVYRNNVFYYLFMPGIWFSAMLYHAGFAHTYAIYASLKMLVIIGAHSSVRWDQFLYQRRALRPLAWLLERTISTPSTHFAHHGRHAADGITNYKGNYGNFLFLWDVIFGTAKITRRYPTEYGLENVEPESWRRELMYPLARE